MLELLTPLPHVTGETCHEPAQCPHGPERKAVSNLASALTSIQPRVVDEMQSSKRQEKTVDVNDRLTRHEDALIDLAVVVSGGHLDHLASTRCHGSLSKRTGSIKRFTGRLRSGLPFEFLWSALLPIGRTASSHLGLSTLSAA